MSIAMTILREDDLETVMAWRMRPDITRYMNTDPVLTIEKQRTWFESIKNCGDQIIWIVRCDDVPIGVVQVMDIDWSHRRCSWGYYIAEKEYRSLQTAIYLEWNLYDHIFDKLKLHKLSCETFVENKGVSELHLMCGSREEGILRQHIFKNGGYHDISVCSVLADEWTEKRRTVRYPKFAFEEKA